MTVVDESAAAGDQKWFDQHRGRRYRVRPSSDGWVVVRHCHGSESGPGFYLRTIVHGRPVGNDDEALRSAWVNSAWRSLSPAERARLLAKIKKAEGKARNAD